MINRGGKGFYFRIQILLGLTVIKMFCPRAVCGILKWRKTFPRLTNSSSRLLPAIRVNVREKGEKKSRRGSVALGTRVCHGWSSVTLAVAFWHRSPVMEPALPSGRSESYISAEEKCNTHSWNFVKTRIFVKTFAFEDLSVVVSFTFKEMHTS